MIPEDIRELMALQAGSVGRARSRDATAQLARLGVAEGAQLSVFFAEFKAGGILARLGADELLDPCQPTPQLAGATDFATEVYDLTGGFVALTSGEGEGFVLYELVSGGVYDVGVEEFVALEAGHLSPRWESFFEYLRWYLNPLGGDEDADSDQSSRRSSRGGASTG